MASLLVAHLQEQRNKGRLLLHEYVVMPDHIHLLLTPTDGVTLERAVQYVKGGFSFVVKKSGAFSGAVWLPSYHDRRIRDANECAEIVRYIRLNPVRRYLVVNPAEFRFSSAHSLALTDPLPQWLKPLGTGALTLG